MTILRTKVALLEEELRKAREEASDRGQLCRQLEKVTGNISPCLLVE